jgi:catechol 2,3-dioxygenase-like lactoylglutathione lyase family enzyme
MIGLLKAVNPFPERSTCVRTRNGTSKVSESVFDRSVVAGGISMNLGKLSHLQINVDAANLPFYKDLFDFLAWEPNHSDETTESFNSQGDISLWFTGVANGATNDRDGAGVNHLGLAAATQADVDQTVAYLTGRGIDRLFETPRHRPDFSSSDENTYYQVMFESPDGILFEHVYTGPKQG